MNGDMPFDPKWEWAESCFGLTSCPNKPTRYWMDRERKAYVALCESHVDSYWSGFPLGLLVGWSEITLNELTVMDVQES